MSNKIPKAVFNCKALFNPYQYLPFEKVLEYDENTTKFAWNNKNLLITDEVGVGKTFEIGIILSELLRNEPDKTVLICCPVKLCDNWADELYENFFIPLTEYRKNKSFGQCTVLPYSYFSGKETKDDSGKNASEEEDKLISEENQNINTASITLPKYDILILDEAHYVRNRNSKLWNCINEMIDQNENAECCKLKIFMTGTPICNSKDDYINITELLKKNNQTYENTCTLQSEANCYDQILKIYLWGDSNLKNNSTKQYGRNKLIALNTVEEEIIDEIYTVYSEINENDNEIEKSKYGRLTGYLKRIAASSFWSLKQFVDNPREIDIDVLKLAAENYEELKKADLKALYETIEKDLKPIVDGWSDDSKYMALRELLKDLERQDKDNNANKFKAIIFSCFMNTCNYLENKLNEEGYSVYKITGETPTGKVTEIKKEFEKNNAKSILICSDAAKEGHNLQFCHYLIHYDLPFTPAAIGQRNGRIYRRGQENQPEVYYLLLNQGYDLRLFGEIIIEKCKVVKKYSDSEQVSAINILPWDAGEYIKMVVSEYIDDYFEKERKGLKDNNDQNQTKDFEIFKKFLEKHFVREIIEDENGNKIIEWTSDAVKNLYDTSTENDNHIEKLKEFYAQNILCPNTSNSNDDGTGLSKIYREKYDKLLKEFLKKYFESIEDSDDGEDATGQFVNACDKYIEGIIPQKDGYLFCHDVLRDKELKLDEYKEKFVMLEDIQG